MLLFAKFLKRQAEFFILSLERVNQKGVRVVVADIGVVDVRLLVGDEAESLLVLFSVDRGRQLVEIAVEILCALFDLIDEDQHGITTNGKCGDGVGVRRRYFCLDGWIFMSDGRRVIEG